MLLVGAFTCRMDLICKNWCLAKTWARQAIPQAWSGILHVWNWPRNRTRVIMFLNVSEPAAPVADKKRSPAIFEQDSLGPTFWEKKDGLLTEWKAAGLLRAAPGPAAWAGSLWDSQVNNPYVARFDTHSSHEWGWQDSVEMSGSGRGCSKVGKDARLRRCCIPTTREP